MLDVHPGMKLILVEHLYLFIQRTPSSFKKLILIIRTLSEIKLAPSDEIIANRILEILFKFFKNVFFWGPNLKGAFLHINAAKDAVMSEYLNINCR